MAQVLTANRLAEGDVVYWRAGAWVEGFGEAEVFEGEVEAKAALAAAQAFVAGNSVVNPYLLDVKDGRPAKEREIIRALGPSVRADLGKQAAFPPSDFARRATPDKPGVQRDDDVSI
jgi:hypothetical protein